MPKSKVGKLVKAWRTQHNLTQEQAAKALGVAVQTVQAYEQDLREPHGLARKALLELISRPPPGQG